MKTALRIGVVTSRFNSAVTSKLEAGALEALKKLQIDLPSIVHVQVAGAFEIPLAVKKLFEMKKVDGVVALGAVIRGDTSHYDYVCNAVERGCSNLALEFGKPVGFGVLTTDNEAQAYARAGGAEGNKGSEAAEICVEMCHLIQSLNS
jgi:6,7-dimethyl-8-ribityllumazine synthase